MDATAWPAPTATAPVDADVRVPGSKSMTNRALLLGALAPGTSTLATPLRSRDTVLMADALRALGAEIDADGATWTVRGGGFTDRPAEVMVGNAGTVLRFVPPLATLARAPVGFTGDPAATRRPVGALLAALRTLGARIDDAGRGTLPFRVVGSGGLPGGTVEIDAATSSQLVSALLLTGPAWAGGVEVRHVGERPVPNAPHLRMTVAMLRDRGVTVEASQDVWRVAPGPVAALDTAVEPDLSSAAPFLAAAAVTAGAVRLTGWPQRSTQPGALLPDLLGEFGVRSALADGVLTVTGPSRLSGAALDLRDAGELTPVLAAVATSATSPSRLTGVDYLRGHETDRLAALARELTALGADVRELPDGLEVVPRPMHGGSFATYDDHRLVMAAAVVGLVVPGVEVENVATVGKTMPDFVARWSAMVGAEAEAEAS